MSRRNTQSAQCFRPVPAYCASLSRRLPTKRLSATIWLAAKMRVGGGVSYDACGAFHPHSDGDFGSRGVRRRPHPKYIGVPIAHRSVVSSAVGVRPNLNTVDSSGIGCGLVTVRECPNPPYTELFKDLCTDPLQITVDVEFDRDISNAVVTAGFYSGSQRCAFTGSAPSHPARTLRL